jgi:peptidoglycan/LPS O-acetylase OafA/YrhL
VGIEEQFYAIWPWIIKSKNPLKSFLKLLAIFLCILGISWIYIFKISNLSTETRHSIQEGLALFFSQFRILTMVIGGIGAYLVFSEKNAILGVLFHKTTQFIVYGVLLLMLCTGFHVPGFNMEFYGIFFCFFILNVANNPNTIIQLEQPIIHYLGKISYGLYIYHPAVIVLCVNSIHYFFGTKLSNLTFNMLLYTSAVLISVLVCELSFRYFETPLLKFKNRFNR